MRSRTRCRAPPSTLPIALTTTLSALATTSCYLCSLVLVSTEENPELDSTFSYLLSITQRATLIALFISLSTLIASMSPHHALAKRSLNVYAVYSAAELVVGVIVLALLIISFSQPELRELMSTQLCEVITSGESTTLSSLIGGKGEKFVIGREFGRRGIELVGFGLEDCESNTTGSIMGIIIAMTGLCTWLGLRLWGTLKVWEFLEADSNSDGGWRDVEEGLEEKKGGQLARSTSVPTLRTNSKRYHNRVKSHSYSSSATLSASTVIQRPRLRIGSCPPPTGDDLLVSPIRPNFVLASPQSIDPIQRRARRATHSAASAATSFPAVTNVENRAVADLAEETEKGRTNRCAMVYGKSRSESILARVGIQ